jgi:4-hydroxybenzoate polyprenyltransferase
VTGKVKTLLVLGRVSNLPTIWTNCLAAAIVTGAQFSLNFDKSLLLLSGLLASLSLLYYGGMCMNDAIDAEWDHQHQNMRPIVKGDIKQGTVYFLAFITMVIGFMGVGLLGQSMHSWLAAVFLIFAIISYNITHKSFRFASVIMGMCRFGVYLAVGVVIDNLMPQLFLAGLGLLIYIAGVTEFARLEHQNQLRVGWPIALLLAPLLVSAPYGFSYVSYWVFVAIFCLWVFKCVRPLLFTETPDVKSFVLGLLAAIPLIDAIMIASMGKAELAVICLLVFFTIPYLHRWVAGT